MLVDAHVHGPSPHPSMRILSPTEWQARAPVPGPFAVGAHPWDLLRLPESAKVDVEHWARQPGCAAIGETGIDRARRIPIELQRGWFLWHWELAEQRGLPLVLHMVRASSDLLCEMKRRRPKTPWQWHHFTGPVNVVKSALKLHPDLYFSFGPQSVRRRDFRTLWDAVPSDRRVLETDDTGVDISEVYRSSGADESQIEHNFRRLFALA